MAPTLESLAADLDKLNTTLNTLLSDGVVEDGRWNLELGLIPGAIDVNNGFTLLSGYLVFFMQAGFAMLSAGSVRAKNAKNIILLNLLDACFGCIGWYITGYAFAFGDPDPSSVSASGEFTFPYLTPFIGHRYFCQTGLPRAVGVPPTNVNYIHWFFQFTFAATSATIVSGAVAERCKFECYVMYNLMLVMFVYPVVAHWVWSPFGWMSATRIPSTSAGQSYLLLFDSGVYDFAGDGPVHMVGGIASLVAAWVLGPRIGRFDSAGNPVDMPGHNAALTLLGVFLLWFGWYGFNPGSTNAILGSRVGFSGITAGIAVNTTISAAAATVSTLLIAMLHNYMTLGVVVWDLIIAGNGALAGLVSITGPCAFVETWAAFIIGFIGGCLYYVASKLILHKLKVDDPLDAIAVHAVSGMWGMLGGAAFAAKDLVANWYGPHPGPGGGSRQYGFIMGGSGNLLGAHIVYILCIATWVCLIMTPFFLLLKRLGLMRVPPEVESLGLDVSYHGGSSYPHDRAHTAGYEVSKGAQVFTKDMAERMLEEGLAALEKRLTGASVHSRKGYPLDPEAVGVDRTLTIAPSSAAAVAAAGGWPGTGAAAEPLRLSDGMGMHRAHALKPLLEVEDEGPSNRSEVAAASTGFPYPPPTTAYPPRQHPSPPHAPAAGAAPAEAPSGQSAEYGGSSHGLSALQQRMAQAYTSSEAKSSSPQ